MNPGELRLKSDPFWLGLSRLLVDIDSMLSSMLSEQLRQIEFHCARSGIELSQ